MRGLAKRKKKKIFLLVIVIAVTAIVLIVETYAWFVGLSTVNTSSFNINVSTGGGLEISLDGENWKKDDQVLNISSSTITATSGTGDHAYEGNTNKWTGEKGLIPLSSSGLLDTTTGHIKFYEKSSLSSTAGGYKIVATQVDNSTQEADGYVVFDLFIRNGTDNVYANGNYGSSGAENVYLKKTSSATVNGSSNYGAANSVRVGFFSIGGIKAYDASVEQIRGLSCSTTNTTTMLKLCPSFSSIALRWNIWEPNYKSHTSNAVSYFNQVCKKRNSSTGEYLTDSCTTLTATSSFNTYSIRDSIDSSDNVDIYDGLNGYSGNYYSSSTNPDGKLYRYTPYRITSSTTYSYNNQLFKLAGNSITKVRVYIWLEGQDVDNYDIITKNSNIIINFGLTKDMYGINE
jgi:hypothetical protein